MSIPPVFLSPPPKKTVSGLSWALRVGLFSHGRWPFWRLERECLPSCPLAPGSAKGEKIKSIRALCFFACACTNQPSSHVMERVGRWSTNAKKFSSAALKGFFFFFWLFGCAERGCCSLYPPFPPDIFSLFSFRFLFGLKSSKQQKKEKKKARVVD